MSETTDTNKIITETYLAERVERERKALVCRQAIYENFIRLHEEDRLLSLWGLLNFLLNTPSDTMSRTLGDAINALYGVVGNELVEDGIIDEWELDA